MSQRKPFNELTDEEKWNAARTAMDNAETRISQLESRVVGLLSTIEELRTRIDELEEKSKSEDKAENS